MKNIKVNDMTCMACVNKIKIELLKNDIVANINLINHEVSVSEKDLNKALKLIEEIGYTPEI